MLVISVGNTNFPQDSNAKILAKILNAEYATGATIQSFALKESFLITQKVTEIDRDPSAQEAEIEVSHLGDAQKVEQITLPVVKMKVSITYFMTLKGKQTYIQMKWIL